MYNILVVDDELFVRKGVIASVDWEECGINIPFEASNGKEAYEIIQSENINILLTDIKMPEMDGLQLIEKAKGFDKDIEVVILSCHDDYTFTRKSMQMGVCDYLFKPTMMPENIKEVLQKVVYKIKEKKKSKNRLKKLELFIERRQDYLIESYLREIIDGKSINKEMQLCFNNALAGELNLCRFSMAYIHIDNLYDAVEIGFNGEKYLLRFALHNIIEEIFENELWYKIITMDKDEILLLYAYKHSSQYQQYKVSTELLTKIVIEVQRFIQVKLIIGVSQSYGSFDKVKTMYEESHKAIKFKFFDKSKKVLFYDEVFKNQQDKSQKDEYLTNRILNLNDMSYEKMKNEVSNILALIKDYLIDVDSIKEICSKILSAILYQGFSFKLVKEKLMFSEKEMYLKIYKATSFDDIERVLNDTIDMINLLIESHYHKYIQQAIQFMEEHLMDEKLTLEMVSNHIHISKPYLSKLFREEMNINFIKYLTELRMGKAKELYENSNMKIYEIAEKVGYSDWRYFSKLYKKYSGTTLSKQRVK